MENESLSIIDVSILLSFILFMVIISIFYWWIDIDSRILFATIFIIFDLIILMNLFALYIVKRKKIILFIIVSFLLLICFSLWKATYKEYNINKVHIGMHKNDVEELLWKWEISRTFTNGSKSSFPLCREWCGKKYIQYYYNLGPNLWYTRLEDTYTICYNNEVICNMVRVGL
jgi:hypothetical protein